VNWWAASTYLFHKPRLRLCFVCWRWQQWNFTSFIRILSTRWKMFPLHASIIGHKFRHTITLYWHIHIVCLGQWLSYGPDDEWILFWFLAQARHFSFLPNDQMICGAYLACSQWVLGATGQGIEQDVYEHSHPVRWLSSSTSIKFFPIHHGEEPNLSHTSSLQKHPSW